MFPSCFIFFYDNVAIITRSSLIYIFQHIFFFDQIKTTLCLYNIFLSFLYNVKYIFYIFSYSRNYYIYHNIYVVYFAKISWKIIKTYFIGTHLAKCLQEIEAPKELNDTLLPFRIPRTKAFNHPRGFALYQIAFCFVCLKTFPVERSYPLVWQLFTRSF